MSFLVTANPICITRREVTRCWLGYIGREDNFCFPPNARVARSLIITIPSSSQKLINLLRKSLSLDKVIANIL